MSLSQNSNSLNEASPPSKDSRTITAIKVFLCLIPLSITGYFIYDITYIHILKPAEDRQKAIRQELWMKRSEEVWKQYHQHLCPPLDSGIIGPATCRMENF